jgi:hypothetical protein
MTYYMKSENKLEGASNFRAWNTRIDLVLAKDKVLDIVRGKIVEPQFEEGKEKEPQNVAVMEKFTKNDINAMSIIVDSVILTHLRRCMISLTNLFSFRNFGQVMCLKNELRDMKMNDDDIKTSYLVRISQLRDQLQAIEEIISEKELVNIVLNGLPKAWDAFAASMNTRKGYPTFEELWTCCAQEESRISAKEKFQRKDDDQTSQQSSRNSGIRRSLTQGRNQIKKRICQKYNASTVENMNHCPELKKRKETHEATIVEEREPSKKVKQDEAIFLLLSQGNNILQSSCTYHVYIVSVHIMYIYFLEDKKFK